mmetsp:Transcript_98124/g.194288  ORF Transcript_98124/g.194288 Transcript_98124/m.194288 type:complete len:144 (+) Transcript_98124:73-504(+)
MAALTQEAACFDVLPVSSVKSQQKLAVQCASEAAGLFAEDYLAFMQDQLHRIQTGGMVCTKFVSKVRILASKPAYQAKALRSVATGNSGMSIARPAAPWTHARSSSLPLAKRQRPLQMFGLVVAIAACWVVFQTLLFEVRLGL